MRDAERVCARCPRPIGESNKSGLCRACWTADGGPRRNAMSKHGQGEVRKTEPEEQAAMALRFVRSFVRRSLEEDPGRVLPLLLAIEDAASEGVREAGRKHVAKIGPQRVAAELSFETGETWTRTRVYKRWVKRG